MGRSKNRILRLTQGGGTRLRIRVKIVSNLELKRTNDKNKIMCRIQVIREGKGGRRRMDLGSRGRFKGLVKRSEKDGLI